MAEEKKDQNDTLTPALAAAITAAVGAAVKPITDAHADLMKNQKDLLGIVETMQGKKGTETAKDKAAEKAEAPKYLTVEELAKALDERESKNKISADQAAARKAAVDALVAKGVPSWVAESNLPPAGDKAAFDKASETIVANVNKDFSGKLADRQGAAGDGGKTPGQGAGGTAEEKGADTGKLANAGLSPGQAAFAASLVMPK